MSRRVLPLQLVPGTDPAPTAGNRGLPLTSAVARQAPLGYRGVCKDMQDQTRDLCEFAKFFSIEFTLKLLFRKEKEKATWGS